MGINEQYVTFSQLKCVLEQMRKSVSVHAPCENQTEDAHTNEPVYPTSQLWEMIFDETEEKVNQLELETKKTADREKIFEENTWQ